MKYKLIVSDFDGTLLRSDNTISEPTRRAIAAYMEAGGTFTISTGRNYPSIRQRLPEAGLGGLDIPVMSLQGSMAVNAKTGEEMFAEFLDTEMAARFIGLCVRDGVYCHVYDKYSVYTAASCAESERYSRMVGVPVLEAGDLLAFIGKNRIIKVLAVCDGDSAARFAEAWGGEMGSSAQVMTTSRHFVECFPAGAGKGAGLRRVADILGVDIADTIAVGDEMNDRSMIEAAGLGVAVANARPAVKALASYVTAANDDDGVRRLIEKFCPEVI